MRCKSRRYIIWLPWDIIFSLGLAELADAVLKDELNKLMDDDSVLFDEYREAFRSFGLSAQFEESLKLKHPGPLLKAMMQTPQFNC